MAESHTVSMKTSLRSIPEELRIQNNIYEHTFFFVSTRIPRIAFEHSKGQRSKETVHTYSKQDAHKIILTMYEQDWREEEEQMQ